MKATLTFKLPEDADEHAYALAGLDALLVIEDLLGEIRSRLKHGGGEFAEFPAEVYDEGTGAFVTKRVEGCEHTLERVAQYICERKAHRKLPEVT